MAKLNGTEMHIDGLGGLNTTPFVRPNHLTELPKCQHYLQRASSPSRFHSTLCDFDVIDFVLPLSVTLYKVPTLMSGIYKVTNTKESHA